MGFPVRIACPVDSSKCGAYFWTRPYRLEITLAEDGTLQLDALPFQKGETVEVIVLERSSLPEGDQKRSLKGSVRRYDDPTEPVALDDGETLR